MTKRQVIIWEIIDRKLKEAEMEVSNKTGAYMSEYIRELKEATERRCDQYIIESIYQRI